MLNFDKIRHIGKTPPPVTSAEEHLKRVELYRSWVRGPFNTALSWLFQFLMGSTFYLYILFFNKMKIINRKKLKEAKLPYLFVTNHLTMIDDMLLGGTLFIPFAFKNMKYFPWHVPEETNFFLGPIITLIMTRSRCIPLTRGHGVFQPGMTRLKELLSQESIVQIYPEGTRSRTGDINRGKVGVGRLAYQTKVNVVPAYHEGAQDMLPIGSTRLQTGKKFAVIVGDPIDMSDLYELKECRETYQKISDRMIEGIKACRAELHAMGHGIHPIPEPKDKEQDVDTEESVDVVDNSETTQVEQ